MDSVPASSLSTAPDHVSSANHKPFVPNIPRKNNKKRRRMRGVITDHVPSNQSNFTWHRQQNLPVHDTTTAELDDTRAKGHLRSKVEGTSRNGRQFNGPSGSYSYPHHDSFQSQRDSCYRLWQQLDAAYDARERHLSMKEEDLARREQAVRTQEQLITHWTAQAQAERMEVAYIRQQAIKLKEQVDAERCKLEAEKVANESGENVDKISERGRTLHDKMDLSQVDHHHPEIEGHSGEDTNMGEMPQNCHNTMENHAGESFEAMRGSSQGCVDTSKTKLDISVKASECLMETIELCEFSSSKVTSYISEKGNDPVQQHRVSNEIVNRALESPAILASNSADIGDSEDFPSKPDKVDVCKEVVSSANDTESSLKPSS